MKSSGANVFFYSLISVELILIGIISFYDFENESQKRFLLYVVIGIGLPLFFFFLEEILQSLDPRNWKDKEDR
jgi:hypothetical protein